MDVPFQGMAGENRIVIRYAKWNGNGGLVSASDATPYAMSGVWGAGANTVCHTSPSQKMKVRLFL